MNQLHDHLAAGDRHAALRFHPDCPVCSSERLAGALPTDRLLTGPVRSGLCLGVLGVSALLTASGPLAASARADDVPADLVAQPGDDLDAEGDDDGQEGVSVDAPDAGPEEAVEVPVQAPAAPPVAAPAPAPGVVTEEPAGAQDDPPEPTAPVPDPPVPAPAPPAPPAVAPSASEEPKEEVEVITDPAPRHEPEHVAPRRAPQAPAAPPAAQPAPATPAPVENPAPAPAASAVAGTTHVLQAGESLWSVASAALGPDASPAQVAAYVHELWKLNAGRIASGDPNMVSAGQTLILPKR